MNQQLSERPRYRLSCRLWAGIRLAMGGGLGAVSWLASGADFAAAQPAATRPASGPIAAVTDAPPDDWRQWRGPQQDGGQPLANPPLRWSATENVQWRVPLTGEGHATPVIAGERLFLSAAVKTEQRVAEPAQPREDAKTVPPDHIYRFVLRCLDVRTGAEQWERVATQAAPQEGKHDTNSYASGSPVTDGQRVIASFGSYGIYAYSVAGEPLWQLDLGDMQTRLGWGEGASPALEDGVLVVNWDQEQDSFIVALNAQTGEELWRAVRDEPTSWATPLITRYADRYQVIVNGTRRVRSYDLHSGELIWECGGQTVNAIPSPVRWQDHVIVMSGYRGAAVYAIPLSAQGDVTDTDKIAWHYHENTPYVPSPVLSGNRLYFVRGNNGILTCLDAATGRQLFGPERLPGIENIYASPVAAQGRVYFTGRDGTTTVIEAGDSLKVLATNKLDEPTDASPVLWKDQLILRTAEHLYSLREAR